MLYLSSSEKGLKNSGLNRDSNPELCNASAVLYQLSSQANWEIVVCIDNKPIYSIGHRAIKMI